MIKPKNLMLAVAASLGLATAGLHAQDSGPLIDKLVQKGILNDQEAEDLRADLVKDFQNTSAGKLNISSSVTELKIYGDVRYRWQYDDQQSQTPEAKNVSQRSRHRFRLRLNADFRFTDNFFGGVALETANAADSGNQTINPGFADSDIYISKYFLGYNVDDWGTVILGKQKNPFYTTDLVWDNDINPVGLTEAIAFHKLGGSAPAPASEGYSKDGKTVATYTASEVSGPDWGGFELSLVAGQFVYDTNNDEAAADSDASNDVYLFAQQLLAKYNFNSKTSLTFAPGFMISNAGDLSGFLNETPYTDTTVSGESRELAILTAPGDFTFAIGGLKTKFYWDVAYNVNGEDRFYDIYGLYRDLDLLTGEVSGYSDDDALAWLVGLEVSAGKGKGSWSLFANYRENGIASVDPNLNDSDFALGRLDTRGFKFGATYGFTDFLTAGITGFVTYNRNDGDDTLFGSATNLANRNAVNTVQVDVTWKF